MIRPIASSQMQTWRWANPERVAVGILVLFAILLRLVPVLKMHYFYLYGDMVHYDHSAVMLITHHVYTYWASAPNAQVTPGYPIFLMLAYKLGWLTAHSHFRELHAALAIQAVLSGVTVWFVYRIARLAIPWGWAFFAAFLWATYPPSVWASQLILTETLYVFLLYLYVWSFLSAVRKPSTGTWLLSGLLLGLTGLVRPTVFPLLVAPVVLALWRAWVQKTKTSPVPATSNFVRRFWQALNWRGFASYVLGFVVLLMPWWIRNYHVFHHLILTDTDAGNPLLFGTDPSFIYHAPAGTAPNETTLALQKIHAELTHQPLAALKWYTVSKLAKLFTTPWYGAISKATPHWLLLWLHLHIVWVLLGAVGLIVGFARPRFRLLSILALFLILVQLPFIPISRYVFPILPLFMMGVAMALHEATARVSSVISRPKRRLLE